MGLGKEVVGRLLAFGEGTTDKSGPLMMLTCCWCIHVSSLNTMPLHTCLIFVGNTVHRSAYARPCAYALCSSMVKTSPCPLLSAQRYKGGRGNNTTAESSTYHVDKQANTTAQASLTTERHSLAERTPHRASRALPRPLTSCVPYEILRQFV